MWGKGEVKDGGYVQTGTTPPMRSRAWRPASNTFLPLDELSRANAADVAKSVYMFGNEGGKGRMSADISMRAIRLGASPCLSSGEKTLAEKIAENRGREAPAGVEMRMINVSADAGYGYGVFDSHRRLHSDGAELADALKKAIRDALWNGWPGFVRAIIEHGVDKVREHGRGMVAAFVKKNATGKSQWTNACAWRDVSR